MSATETPLALLSHARGEAEHLAHMWEDHAPMTADRLADIAESIARAIELLDAGARDGGAGRVS